MAQTISGNINGLSGVRCDLVRQSDGIRIDVVHSELGIWEFAKPVPDVYDIRFIGRDVTEADWIIGYEVFVGDPNLGGTATYTFWDGVAPYDESKNVQINEFGWYNQSQLKFHIAADGNGKEIDAIYYRLFYNGAWTSWTPDAATGTTHEVDIDIAGLANIEGENDIIEFYVLMGDGSQLMVTTVHFKYDASAPTFNITPVEVVGGFGRIGLTWTNDDVSDSLSGVAYIRIYRDTNDSFAGAEELENKITIVDQSVIPNTFIDDSMPSDDQATKYFYWGKAQDRAGNLSPESRLENEALGTSIVLLLPADVDGALRIQNNPSGVNWEVVYGIRVPIQSAIITAGILSNVTEIDAIQYKEDDDDTWHDVPTPQFNGQTVSFPYSISGMDEGETLTLTYPTVILDKKYHRVVFDHADADTEIANVHFESILAADIIVGGVLRLEKGLSIWTGIFNGSGVPTGSGMFIDKLGLQMWDAFGQVNQRLNNDGSASLGRSGGGNGQITIDTSGVITIDSKLLTINSDVIFASGYDPSDKNTTFRQASDPSSGWSPTEKIEHTNDRWVDTGNPGDLIYTWTGSVWVQDYTLIDGGNIDTYSITAEKLAIGANSFTTNIIFEPDDTIDVSQYIKWNGGTIEFASGETKTSIPAGDDVAISNPRSWIYYNEGSPGSILATATYSDAVGDGKTLMAIVDRGDPAGGSCVIAPVNNTGTTLDADGIRTGRLSSLDGKTYFDLINNLIKLFATTTRVEIGDLGSTFGIKILDGANNLLLHIDETTQIIKTADGNTYIDLGGNQIVMLGGSITGADIKTAASGERAEMDSSGLRVYSEGKFGAGAYEMYKDAVLEYAMGLEIDLGATTGISFWSRAVSFLFNKSVTIIGSLDVSVGANIGGDAIIDGKVDSEHFERLTLKTSQLFTANNDTNDWGDNTHIRLIGTSGINIRRIKRPTSLKTHFYLIEPSTDGNVYDLIDTYGSSGDYRQIRTPDGNTLTITGDRPIQLMYSVLRDCYLALGFT